MKYKYITQSGVFMIIQYNAVCPLLLFKVSVLHLLVKKIQHPNLSSFLTFELRPESKYNLNMNLILILRQNYGSNTKFSSKI